MSDGSPADLSTFGEFKNDKGGIAFIGMIRVRDEGVNEFRVELPGHQAMYGEWRPQYESNGNDLNVQIVSFGYTAPSNVGNVHPAARKQFKDEEIVVIEELIKRIFEQDSARGKVFPFTIKKSRFLGKVVFSSDWVNRS